LVYSRRADQNLLVTDNRRVRGAPNEMLLLPFAVL
jgi:hypothetical protein